MALCAKAKSTTALTIAFCYESASEYRSRGVNEEECAELDSDETIVAIASSILSLGHSLVKLGDIEGLVGCLARGDFKQWDLVFSISQGLYGAAREAQVPALCEGYRIPHVLSDAATLALCLDKGRTKIILEHYGIRTAPFAIAPPLISCSEDVDPVPQIASKASDIITSSKHAASLQQYPLFLKPACACNSKGIYPFSKVHSASALESSLRQLRTRFPDQSILIEKFLRGREYTVSILGTGSSARVIGTMQIIFKSPTELTTHAALSDQRASSYPDVDFYAGDMKKTDCYEYAPVEIIVDNKDAFVLAAEEVALAAWRALGCCDLGRVDVRYDEMDDTTPMPYVLEVNPLPGLRPNWSQLPATAMHAGFTHTKLIGAVINSAVSRYGIKPRGDS